LPNYRKHLRSFHERNNLVTTAPNDVEALHAVFAKAEEDGVFFEAMFIEPVMGEGNPGLAITPEFYQAARTLTAANDTLFLVDSIQAGLRAHGVLSIVDYPGFQGLEGPDMESYSKALNAGQYPLSVLAVNEKTAGLYAKGVYGNTMTCNPRALEVACSVLDAITPEMRDNVCARGAELVDALKALADAFPDAITEVQGTGLLVSVALDPKRYTVVGFGGVEEHCRIHGLGVIHGGTNALRFTPHFGISSEETALIVSVVRQSLIALGS
jgi:acetylornithine/succinyldiaminopimelate/putrescine aminotransferase